MKNIIATILAVVLSAGAAVAVDFSSIITENSKAQNELHFKIIETVKSSRLAAELAQRGTFKKYIADSKETIHTPTQKEFLTFAKEKTQFKPSGQQATKRLAEEFKDLE